MNVAMLLARCQRCDTCKGHRYIHRIDATETDVILSTERQKLFVTPEMLRRQLVGLSQKD